MQSHPYSRSLSLFSPPSKASALSVSLTRTNRCGSLSALYCLMQTEVPTKGIAKVKTMRGLQNFITEVRGGTFELAVTSLPHVVRGIGCRFEGCFAHTLFSCVTVQTKQQEAARVRLELSKIKKSLERSRPRYSNTNYYTFSLQTYSF